MFSGANIIGSRGWLRPCKSSTTLRHCSVKCAPQPITPVDLYDFLVLAQLFFNVARACAFGGTPTTSLYPFLCGKKCKKQQNHVPTVSLKSNIAILLAIRPPQLASFGKAVLLTKALDPTATSIPPPSLRQTFFPELHKVCCFRRPGSPPHHESSAADKSNCIAQPEDALCLVHHGLRQMTGGGWRGSGATRGCGGRRHARR